jgi:hypothetical protein
LNKASKNNAILMDNLVPSEFYLSQNYPNPFKDKTSIKYCLSERTKVELTIFNSNGEKVKELFNKVQNAGTYKTIFNGQNFSAGVYYYQLKAMPVGRQAGKYVETRKMVHIK